MFVKYPEKGMVKSRLSRHFDEEMIACLYRKFIEDLIERLSGGDYQFRIAYHPTKRKNDFSREFGDALSYMPQMGADLGEKMYNAFIQCFSEGFRSTVIIGSDSPDLPQKFVHDAFKALGKRDAVIGPSHDGGYYLIGFCRESFTPEAFEGIAWSTDSVFKQTMEALDRAAIHVHVLPVWRDVDRPEDIHALVEDSLKNGFSGSKTISFLRDHDLARLV